MLEGRVDITEVCQSRHVPMKSKKTALILGFAGMAMGVGWFGIGSDDLRL